VARVLDPIDHILSLDLSRRGIARFVTAGAALAAARALTGARRVLITTGFTVADGMPETDGPPGATVLGTALARLGAEVDYVTDAVNVPLIAECLKVLGASAEIHLYPGTAGAAPALLARARPTHLVAIERPGRTASGEYLSARGESVARWNRPVDELFFCSGCREAGSNRGWAEKGAARHRHARTIRAPVTIGIGDGGNEIGMGNVRATLGRVSPLMKRIASAVRVDHLVVAPVSNWGGYAIVAALSRLTGRPLLHDAAVERRLVEACVDAGAHDGMTRRREATVDALPLDVHAAVVELLGRCIMNDGSARERRGRKASRR
jgi:hypothetical protein